MQILCLDKVKQLVLSQGTIWTTSIHTGGQSSFANMNVCAVERCHLLNTRKSRE